MKKSWTAGAAFLALLGAAGGGAQADPAVSPVQMSQVGFETQGPKTATVPDTSPRPLPWRITDTAGKVVAQGQSKVFGPDAASGHSVHIVDFQSLQTDGQNYRLTVGNHESRPFSILQRPHAALKYDALAYFYQNRAGVPILASHVSRPDLTRAAGHPHEVAACFSGADTAGVIWPGCDYTLDVTGGWYDAGDHGKYVVNGGVSVWMLLNAYERAAALKSPGAAAFADGKVNIPEAGNGVNDLLDEARYEIEFLLKMQVPDGVKLTLPVGTQTPGQPLNLVEVDAGGMVHHKVHDAQWTAIPMAPADDPQPRLLYPPSTAATLNLAAVGAQCARIWREIDPAFARQCLTASQRAFRAALRNRDVRAGEHFAGGGAYGDQDFSDEFYWATAELLATTGNPAYLTALKTSPYFLGGPLSGKSATGDPAWARTAALGSLTLATVPGALSPGDLVTVRANIVAAARSYVQEGYGQGYGLPFAGTDYDWGSNGALMNRAVILASAFDYTGDWNYRNAVIWVLDYLLGRNPLDRSYVTGYGDRPVLNPHHRFWAHQADPAYPLAPAGALSGGPNNRAMSDDVAKNLSGRCAPQTCWADDINAYALNEVAINWNAPLVWVAAFIDDR
ncbi:glycoside hydrolase family 9 protein [Brevundimonas sp. SORGH_AS_0993]|uniref:glycoside hydrolase family 9 protein n=1 Tax=Brevundimonas sp. SORGH_AS_0993 TaxID=3041794 RepID=UPI0027840F03|nr:glycoside hydrolase family 9 protein [Brevundimonas sp. SORGH_AS_0993]MDQ1153260.1 endoglucanase [Brevundimonas sp. SORGH_AS_0993]